MKYHKYPEEVRADGIERVLKMTEHVCEIDSCEATIQGQVWRHPWKDLVICWDCYNKCIDGAEYHGDGLEDR